MFSGRVLNDDGMPCRSMSSLDDHRQPVIIMIHNSHHLHLLLQQLYVVPDISPDQRRQPPFIHSFIRFLFFFAVILFVSIVDDSSITIMMMTIDDDHDAGWCDTNKTKRLLHELHPRLRQGQTTYTRTINSILGTTKRGHFGSTIS